MSMDPTLNLSQSDSGRLASLEARLAALEARMAVQEMRGIAAPLLPLPGVATPTWPIPDCGCLPGTICNNSACPRAPKVTC